MTRFAIAGRAVCTSFLLLCGGAFAQSLNFEQPAPSYAYETTKPDYLHFKDVTVTRNSKNSLEFEFRLQGKLPEKFAKGEGVRYKVYFDLENLVCDYNEKKIPPDFASDLIIAVYQNPNTSKFDSWVDVVQVKNKVHEIKITKLKASEDKISFSARCPLFGEVEGLRFMVSSGFLDAREGRAKDLQCQDSKIFNVPFKGDGSLDLMSFR